MLSTIIFLISFLSKAAIASSSVFPPERCRGGQLWKDWLHAHYDASSSATMLDATSAEASSVAWNAPVDHFDSEDNSTYRQRYFLNDEFFSNNNSSSYVFLMIGGEGTLMGPPAGFMAELASEWGALLVSLEHRFYGKSFPHHDMSTKSYSQYFSVNQALADVAAFSDYLQEELYPERKLEFFTFGGSYPGALSAWYRIAYPDKTRGSLSSSGVVNAILNFPEFDQQVARAIGKECANRVSNITAAFEQALQVPEMACVVKGMFGCDCEMWDPDFFYMLADSAAMVDQYGNKSVLCEAMLDGLGPDPSPFEMVVAFAKFTNHYYGPQFGSSCFYDSRCAADLSRATLNERSWRWQKCSQLAYFQVYPEEGGEQVSLRSSQVTLEYHLEQCQRIFGATMEKPSVDAINAQFGGATPKATRVYYSNFGDDPWQMASVREEFDAVNQPFELAVYDGAGHCSDLHASKPTDHPNLVKLRERFKGYLKKWLTEDEEEEEEMMTGGNGMAAVVA